MKTFSQASPRLKIYESQKVAAIFGPLVQATINKIEINDSNKIIDVACDTGIVGRMASKCPRRVTCFRAGVKV
jgi:hypothetical protein